MKFQILLGKVKIWMDLYIFSTPFGLEELVDSDVSRGRRQLRISSG